jgi:putative phosphoesterase
MIPAMVERGNNMSRKSRNVTFKTRIGVVSDTHVPKQAQQLPEELLQQLEKVDFIIHAGDFEDLDTLKELRRINRLVAVSGNMDSKKVQSQLQQREVLNVDHYKIGIIHGWGDPHTLPRRALEQFKSEGVDCVVFGHSHQACNEIIDGVLMFNPGSPTDTIYAHFKSFGILETSPEGIKGEIIRLNS